MFVLAIVFYFLILIKILKVVDLFGSNHIIRTYKSRGNHKNKQKNKNIDTKKTIETIVIIQCIKLVTNFYFPILTKAFFPPIIIYLKHDAENFMTIPMQILEFIDKNNVKVGNKKGDGPGHLGLRRINCFFG